MIKYRKTFYKTIIAGDGGVGKTTLLHQYIRGQFKPDIPSTVASNFFVKYVKIPQVKSVITLQIWDLAGQEHFKWVRQAFYKGAKGVVYMFDLTRRKTIYSLHSWKEEIENTIGKIPNLLVGNKLDLLASTGRSITSEESNTFKTLLASCAYYETSAKFGTGVDNIFEKLAMEMYKSLNES